MLKKNKTSLKFRNILPIALMVILLNLSCDINQLIPGQESTAPPDATFQPEPTLPPEPSPTITITPIAEIKSESEVRRLIPNVFAGNTLPLTELNSDSSFELPAGGLVSTNLSGEAEVIIDGCLTLFIFQDSSLEQSPCRRQDQQAGLAVCSIAGLTGVLNECLSQIEIQTPSGNVTTSGTWFSVLYLPQDQISIVQVYEGEVEVQAFINPQIGTMTEEQTVPADSLWFTYPGAEKPDINGVAGRGVRDLQVWEAMRPALIENNPRLDIWMNALQNRAEERNQPFPEYLSPPTGQVNLTLIGNLWQDTEYRDAVLVGIDWLNLTQSVWDFGNVTPRIEFGNTVIDDARQIEYNPITSQTYFTERITTQVYNPTQIAVHDWNWSGQEFAYSLQDILLSYGIDAQILFLSEEGMRSERERAGDESFIPYIFIEVSGDVFIDL